MPVEYEMKRRTFLLGALAALPVPFLSPALRWMRVAEAEWLIDLKSLGKVFAIHTYSDESVEAEYCDSRMETINKVINGWHEFYLHGDNSLAQIRVKRGGPETLLIDWLAVYDWGGAMRSYNAW
jgi:hypothetical protein